MGAIARGETRFPYDIVGPTPCPLPLNTNVVPTRHMPDHPLRGLDAPEQRAGWAVKIAEANSLTMSDMQTNLPRQSVV